jgi:hypothetical protein
MSDIKIPYGSGEKEWEFPELEIEMIEKKSALRVLELNEPFDINRHHDPIGDDPINKVVDGKNLDRYHPNGGFKYGVFSFVLSNWRSRLEMWTKSFLNIDKLPGISTWRVVKHGSDPCYIVRVGSTTDIMLKLKEEQNEK